MGKKVVVPGDFLALEEEYLGGANTFTDDEGNVYSDSIGKAMFDDASRTVTISKEKPVSKLSVSTVVIGYVHLVKDSVVVIRMAYCEEQKGRRVVAPTQAFLKVANVSRAYVKLLRDEFKIGDLVVAKICEITPFGIQLRTNEPNLGVIRAHCTKCRSILHLSGRDLRCLNCGNVERRKTSMEYVLK